MPAIGIAGLGGSFIYCTASAFSVWVFHGAASLFFSSGLGLKVWFISVWLMPEPTKAFRVSSWSS